jgi:hypothetical protein
MTHMFKKSLGSNQYKDKFKRIKGKTFMQWHWFIRFLVVIALCWVLVALAVAIKQWYDKLPTDPIVSPVSAQEVEVYKVKFLNEAEAKESTRGAIPNMVEMSAEKFTKNTKQKNHIMYQLFCLLREESNLGEVETCGDSGKSCGVLQFREATYNRMRREMIRKGLVTELGDRFSPFYSIETTAYALVQGYGNEWGPISRGECK